MSRSYLGILLAILSMLLFSITYAIFKACNPYIPNVQIIFIQSACSWILIVPFIFRGVIQNLKTEKFWLIAARTVFGLLGMICITAALRTTDLAEVVLLNNTAPLFVPLIIWFWHKVKISGFLGLSLIVGFGGVVLVLRPGFETLRIGLILGAISGVFSALLLVVTRQIAGEPFIRILFYYYLLWWGLLLPFILFFWEATPLFLWLWLIGSALASIGAQWAFTAALRFAPSLRGGPFYLHKRDLFWNHRLGHLARGDRAFVSHRHARRLRRRDFNDVGSP